jgi:hypothetical protein
MRLAVLAFFAIVASCDALQVAINKDSNICSRCYPRTVAVATTAAALTPCSGVHHCTSQSAFASFANASMNKT